MQSEEVFLRASPNPVPLGEEGLPGTTTISWSTGEEGLWGQVYVSEDGGRSEKLFAEGSEGSQAAPWIGDSKEYEFRLYTGLEHKMLLASVKVIRGPEWQPEIAHEPDLVPPLTFMRTEGISVLEEWFHWAHQWSMLLRLYGRITWDSRVLEIGCGLGRIAYPLRYVLSSEGSYDGFDISPEKLAFLERNFSTRYPNFNFRWADIHNTYYNPDGGLSATEYCFPYTDQSFDIVYAASVFTHMLPDSTAWYFKEANRVLAFGGRCLFSFFLLDNYCPDRSRPFVFGQDFFNFDHPYGNWGHEFAVADLDNPEMMTAYRLTLIERFAHDAELRLAQDPLPGLWSAASSPWVLEQDVVVLTKA